MNGGYHMTYITPKQAAENWGISERYVQQLLYLEAVPNAVLAGNYYLIQSDTTLPSIRNKGKFPAKKNVYETISNTALRWGVTSRWILLLISKGIITQAIRIGHNYYMPTGIQASDCLETQK